MIKKLAIILRASTQYPAFLPSLCTENPFLGSAGPHSFQDPTLGGLLATHQGSDFRTKHWGIFAVLALQAVDMALHLE